MTFIAVIIRADEICFLADSMFSDPLPIVYSMDNQKIFFSRKHRIGMCICDHMLIVHKEKEETDFFVNHVLRDFFDRIETEEEIVSHAQFQDRLLQFIDENYPKYYNYLRSQSPGEPHRQDCNYLIGSLDQNRNFHATCHFEGEEKYVQNIPTSFTNHDSTFHKRLTELANKRQCASLETLFADHFEEILSHAVPLTCADVNKEEGYAVGKDLHIIRVARDGTITETFHEYSVAASEDGQRQQVAWQLRPEPIEYVQIATLGDEIDLPVRYHPVPPEFRNSKLSRRLAKKAASSSGTENKDNKDSNDGH
jgi:hypothetical protein